MVNGASVAAAAPDSTVRRVSSDMAFSLVRASSAEPKTSSEPKIFAEPTIFVGARCLVWTQVLLLHPGASVGPKSLWRTQRPILARMEDDENRSPGRRPGPRVGTC